MIGVEAILVTDHRRTRGARKGRRRTVGKGPIAVVDRRLGIALVHALGQDSAGIASADCEKSIEYSTIPRELRGASLMSWITALSGSFGAISPDAVPSSCSYSPTLPQDVPPNAGDVFAVITMPVIRASAVGAALNNVKAATAMALVERK